jgi:hypothetical protein
MTCNSNGFAGSAGSMKYHGTAPTGKLRRLRDCERRLGGVPKKEKRLTGRSLAEIVNLLECKLAWYGFRAVEIGPFVKVNRHTISIDLSQRGAFLGRIEVDRESGAVTAPAGLPLSPEIS